MDKSDKLLAAGITTVGLLGSGILAYKTGALKPLAHKLIKTLGSYRRGEIVGFNKALRNWSEEEGLGKLGPSVINLAKGRVDAAKQGISEWVDAIKKFGEYVDGGKEEHAKRIEKLAGKKLIDQEFTSHRLFSNRNNFLKELKGLISNEDEVDKAAEKANDFIMKTIQVSKKEQDEHIKQTGFKFATIRELVDSGEVAADDDFIKQGRILFQNAGKKADDFMDTIADRNILIDEAGDIVDMRDFNKTFSGFINSVSTDFTIPIIKINPLRMFYADQLFKVKEDPFFHITKSEFKNPIVTGHNGSAGKPYVFVGGDVYEFNKVNDSFEMNEKAIATNMFLADAKNGPIPRLIRNMSGITISKYNKPTSDDPIWERIRYNLTSPLGIGFQDEPVATPDIFDPMSYGQWAMNKMTGWLSNSKYQVRDDLLKDAFGSNTDYIYMRRIKSFKEDGVKDTVGQWFAGRKSLEDVTVATLFPYGFFERLNATLNQVRLGLPNTDLGSGFDIFKNLVLKRVAPIWAGAEAIQYLNYESENIFGKQFTDKFAEMYADSSVELAGLRDSLGVTDWAKDKADLFFGGDQITGIPVLGNFFDLDDDEEETKEYWAEGYDPVRKGRFWPLGNTPYTGSKIDYWQPNWVRRTLSDYEYTDVKYGSREEYFENSWMPTLRHPLAPLRHFFTDQYHWEEKHYKDRPYLLTGGLAELEEFPLVGPILNQTLGQLLKPTRKMHEDVWNEILNKEEWSKETVQAQSIPNDPMYGQQWGMQALDVMGAIENVVGSNPNPVVVAVLDTGIDENHPEFKGRLYQGYNSVDNNTDVTDVQGHGTHVAGIIGATGGNAEGIAGVAYPVVKILPVKVLSDSGRGSIDSVRGGLEFAINWRGPKGETVDVINMSLGSDVVHDIYGDLIQEADRKGITTVVSAGNSNLEKVGSPALSPETIAVGAIDPSGKRAYYSNFGYGLDLAAPGSDMLSTVPLEQGGYGVKSGTSMASPFVAGVVSLLKAQQPDLKPTEIRYILRGTALDFGDQGWDQFYGWGVVDPLTATAVNKELTPEEKEQIAWGGNLIQREISEERKVLLDILSGSVAEKAAFMQTIVDDRGTEYSDPTRVGGALSRFYKNLKEMGGFYGFTLEAATGGTEGEMPEIATSRGITSYRRGFWDSNIGGYGGDANEIFRRFVGNREKWDRRYNPVRNTMPEWMPGSNYFVDFQHGDPYIKVAKGEMRLPGEGYEQLHGIDFNKLWEMNVSASKIGYDYGDIRKHVLKEDTITDEDLLEILDKGTEIHKQWEKEYIKKGIAVETEGYVRDNDAGIGGFFDLYVDQDKFIDDLFTQAVDFTYYEATDGGGSSEYDGYFNEGLKVDLSSQASRDAFKDWALSKGRFSIADAKTRSDNSWLTKEMDFKNTQQINFYALQKDAGVNYLVHINRDNPEKGIKVFAFETNNALYKHTKAKVQKVREDVRTDIIEGKLHRSNLYDPMDRYRILADVAPYSEEFTKVKEQLKYMQLNDNEKAEKRKIDARMSMQKDRHRFYDYRFKTADLDTQMVTIERVIDNNTFIAKEHPNNPIRLAGLYATTDKTKEEHQKIQEILGRTIKEGARVKIAYTSDEQNRIKNDTYRTIDAIVYDRKNRNLNRYLLEEELVREEENDFSPASIHARFTDSEIAFGAAWERFAHLDTILHTKFLQVRSPLESYKRREVYGKDWQEWTDPIDDFLIPYFQNAMAKNPIITIGAGAFIGAAFGSLKTTDIGVQGDKVLARYGKIVGGTVGASVAALAVGYRIFKEVLSNETWIPERRIEERDTEEYFDVLKYIKYNALFNEYADLAIKKEGFNVEEYLNNKEEQEKYRKNKIENLESIKRQLYTAKEQDIQPLLDKLKEWYGIEASDRKTAMSLINAELNKLKEVYKEDESKFGEYTRAALSYKEEIGKTMYGYKQGDPLSNFLAALPKKDRDYLVPFSKAPEEERKEILGVVPNYMKRVLQSLWGMPVDEKLPLEEYFKKHPLPDAGWEGWKENVNIEDIKVKFVDRVGLDPSEFDIWPEDQRRADMVDAPIPNVFDGKESAKSFADKIRDILSESGLDQIDVNIVESNKEGIHLDMNIDQDRTRDFKNLMNREGESVF